MLKGLFPFKDYVGSPGHIIIKLSFIGSNIFSLYVQGIIVLLTSRLGGGQIEYSHLYSIRMLNNITGIS